MSTYVGLLQRIASESAPAFLRNRYGRAFLEAIGLTLDVCTETLHRGLDQAHPLVCASASLPIIGADRGIRRYPTEPEASYRIRLARWRQIKAHAGSHYGEAISLQPYFLPASVPMIRIVHQDGLGASATWHTLSERGVYSVRRATPSNWDWSGDDLSWSRFWVIIYVDATMGPLPNTWNDGHTWNDGEIWGGYLTDGQIADIVSILLDSKAAHSTLAGVILATDPASFDPTGSGAGFPDGTWRYVIDPADNLPKRLASALYAYDNGAP